MAHGHCISAQDLYRDFDVKKLKSTSYDLDAVSTASKQGQCASLFLECLGLMIDDIIDNCVDIRLPASINEGHLYMKPYKGNEFKEAFKRGCFRDVDFLASNYTGYRIGYRTEPKGIKKEFYVKHALREKINNNTNLGIKY